MESDTYIQQHVRLENLKEGEARAVANFLDDVQQNIELKLHAATAGDWTFEKYIGIHEAYGEAMDQILENGILPKLKQDGLEFTARNLAYHEESIVQSVTGKTAKERLAYGASHGYDTKTVYFRGVFEVDIKGETKTGTWLSRSRDYAERYANQGGGAWQGDNQPRGSLAEEVAKAQRMDTLGPEYERLDNELDELFDEFMELEDEYYENKVDSVKKKLVAAQKKLDEKDKAFTKWQIENKYGPDKYEDWLDNSGGGKKGRIKVSYVEKFYLPKDGVYDFSKSKKLRDELTEYLLTDYRTKANLHAEMIMHGVNPKGNPGPNWRKLKKLDNVDDILRSRAFNDHSYIVLNYLHDDLRLPEIKRYLRGATPDQIKAYMAKSIFEFETEDFAYDLWDNGRQKNPLWQYQNKVEEFLNKKHPDWKVTTFYEDDADTVLGSKSYHTKKTGTAKSIYSNFDDPNMPKAAKAAAVKNPGAAIVAANLSPEAIYTAAISEPFHGKVMERWARELIQKDKAAVSNILRQGWLIGESPGKMLEQIKPVLLRSRRDLMTITRTYYAHLAAQTKEAVWKNNEDLFRGYVWDSILDDRTTISICAPRDQKKYDLKHQPVGHTLPWGNGPGMMHWNCRSTSFPLIKGVTRRVERQAISAGSEYERGDAWTRTGKHRVNSKYTRDKGIYKDTTVKVGTTYEQWLKKQPKAFQEDVLGVAKAKAFRSGKWKLGSKFTPQNPKTLKDF